MLGELGSGAELEVAGKSAPENFRGAEAGYYPDRIVEQTARIGRLQKIIDTATAVIAEEQRELVAKRLFDLVVYNAYGNVFAPVNSAGDAVGLPDEEKYGDIYKNSVSLIVRGKDGCLAPAGGFNDIGEGVGQTIGREHEEEVSTQLLDPAVITELSRPNRDERFTVISTVVAGSVNPHELHASDDAGKVVVVSLVDSNGSFNEDLFRVGTHTDIEGRDFSHNGMFAGHDETLRALYDYWQTHGKHEGLTLSQTVKKMSSYYPQEWFKGYTAHPAGTDNYEKTIVDGKTLRLTPNIRFAREKVAKIFSAAGVPDAEEKALAFISQAVESDILPTFPQPSVTTDVLALTSDNKNLWVIKMSDGTLRLPGSFYSPEHTDVEENLQGFAKETVYSKLGVSFESGLYLGAVGGTQALERFADTRYPRVSHIFAGSLKESPRLNQELYPGGEVVAIPIFGPDGQLSQEITESTWVYDHGTEIVEPLIRNAIALRELDRK